MSTMFNGTKAVDRIVFAWTPEFDLSLAQCTYQLNALVCVKVTETWLFVYKLFFDEDN